MKKLLYLLTVGFVLTVGACAETNDSTLGPTAETAPAAATNAKGFFYLLDNSGRHLRSGHLPHNHQDHKWVLQMQAETTNAEILHIWLDEDFVTVEL